MTLVLINPIAALPPAFVAQAKAEHGGILTDPINFEPA